MTSRTTSRSVTFAKPFKLRGVDGERPAGTYTVETDEELIPDLSFAAYRRVATHIVMPGQSGGVTETVKIDPLELQAALDRELDAAAEQATPADRMNFEFRPPRFSAHPRPPSNTAD